MTFLFPFPSHLCRIIPIPMPTHSHSYFQQRLYIQTTLKPGNMYIVRDFKTKYGITAESYFLLIKLTTHQSSSVITITITASYHCSLFNIYQTVTACYCAKTAGCSHYRWEFYKICYSHSHQQPKTTPIPMGIPWESPVNGNSHSHGHF